MKKNKGFTLIELLIAMSIGTLIAMAFFSFLNSSIKFNSKNEQDIKALNIAQSEIENLREQIKMGEDSEFETTDGKLLIKQNDKYIWSISDNIENQNKDIYMREIRIEMEEDVDYLYTIYVNIKKEGNLSTKKETSLVTKVFGG